MLKMLLPFFCLILSVNIQAASSREGRSNKKFEFTFQAGGDYRMSPTQLAGMYFIDANNLVGLKVGVDRTGKDFQTSIATQYKYYTGNSFYVAGEVFYLNTREDTDGLINDIFSIHEGIDAQYTSLGAGIRFGNQWTWKHFTLGCDWIGMGQRIGKFKKESSKLDDTVFTFFNFIIGASF